MTHRTRLGLRLAPALTLAASLLVPAPAPAAPLGAGQWQTVPAENPVAYQRFLGVDGIAPNVVWAVGSRGNGPLVERWDGAAWSVVPDAAGPGFHLADVAVVAADDVWAVGASRYPNYQPVLEHWDGSAWRLAALPPIGAGGLTGLSARAADDVWAVGWYEDQSDGGSLYLHWDGSTWTRVDGPEAVWDWMDVSALAPDDVWAVGNLGVDHSVTNTITHWDGAAWTVSPSPVFRIGSHERFRILALAPDDVWVVGNFELADSSLRVAIEHWDGTEWTMRSFPDLEVADYGHFGIAGTARDDVWVVGSYLPGGQPGGKTLTMHWDGAAWSVVPSPSPASVSILEDAAALPGGVVWAVGDYDQGDAQLNLTMVRQDALFADSFESGDTSGWSAAAP